MTELLALRGVVEASPDAVAEILLDVRPGGRSPMAVSGEVGAAGGSFGGSHGASHGDPSGHASDHDEFAVTKDGSRITVVVDRAARWVSQQGEWWYRGVTSVEPDPRGSLVVHRIYNIAGGNRWAVRFVSRGPLRAAPGEFAAHVEAVGRELGVPAWVVDD